MLDQHEGLAAGVDVGAVEGVTGYDLDVGGEVDFEGSDFGGFAGGLPADNGTLFGCFDLVSYTCIRCF